METVPRSSQFTNMPCHAVLGISYPLIYGSLASVPGYCVQGSITVPHHPSRNHETSLPQSVEQQQAPDHPPQRRDVPSTVLYNGLRVPNPQASQIPFGVLKVEGYDPSADAETIRNATKGLGTDDELLTKTLTMIPVLQMDALADCYVAKYGTTLVNLLKSETSGHFRMGMHALATGPLAWDIELLHEALSGFRTDWGILTTLILGQTSEDVACLSMGYRSRYGIHPSQKIRGRLDAQTARLFMAAFNSNRPSDSTPVDQNMVARDIETLSAASQRQRSDDEMVFLDVILRRSTPHLAAVIGGYAKKHNWSLTKVIKSKFSGHMRESLLYLVEGAKPKRDGGGIWRDAKLIHKTMVGLGTRDGELVWRVVRAHWDPQRMAAVKWAYQWRTTKTLSEDVASETSGSYRKLMLALIEGSKLKVVMEEQMEKSVHTRRRVVSAAASVLGATADVAREALSAGVELLELAPVPGLASAARVLLNIWSAVQQVHANRAECLRLTERCAEILTSIRDEITESGDVVGVELSGPITKLVESFSHIHGWLQEHAHQQSLERYRKRDEILHQIKICDTKLSEALAMFQIRIGCRILKHVSRGGGGVPGE